MLVWQRPNLLLLDEPTNHLDLDDARGPEHGAQRVRGHGDACQPRPGPVARGLRRVLAGRRRRRSEPFDGDLDDYQKWLLDVSRAAARGQPLPPAPSSKTAVVDAPAAVVAPAAKANPAPAASRDDRKSQKQQRAKQADATRPQRAELQRIETRLARLAVEKTETEAKLAAPGTGVGDFAELGRQLAHVNAETTVLEERWLALQGELA